MDKDAEDYKNKDCAFSGPAWSAIVYIDTMLSVPTAGKIGAAVGDACRGLSFYAMRADYLPPKKNVFARALDKLDEFLVDMNRVPVTIPVRRVD
jgi:hypothetical protein